MKMQSFIVKCLMCSQAGLSKGVLLPGKSKVNSKELNSLTVNLLKISRTVEYLGTTFLPEGLLF